MGLWGQGMALITMAWVGVCLSGITNAVDHDRSDVKMVHRQRLNKILFSQIEADLGPWQESGISLEEVERTYCTAFEGGYVDGGFRLQIIAGEMFVVGELIGYPEFNRNVKLFLLEVARHHKLPDVDLVLSTSDKCHQPGRFRGNTKKCSSLGPLFSYAKQNTDKHCVLYPDHTFNGWPAVYVASWQDTWELMEARDLYPWSQRQDKLYFRGALTGNRAYVAQDGSFMNDTSTDVRFSRWSGDPNATHIALPEHCDYKYLLHLPGQAYSSRLKNLLLCKSPVIFPKDDYNEFWYHLLEDGENIVFASELTFEGNATDILKALRDLQADPTKAEKIAFKGHELVRRPLRPDNVKRYFAQLITSYAALQRFSVTKHPDAIPMAISALSPDRNTTMAGRTCDICS